MRCAKRNSGFLFVYECYQCRGCFFIIAFDCSVRSFFKRFPRCLVDGCAISDGLSAPSIVRRFEGCDCFASMSAVAEEARKYRHLHMGGRGPLPSLGEGSRSQPNHSPMVGRRGRR